MNGWWHQMSSGQRLALFGLVVVLYLLGMHTWFWGPLDQSIEVLHGEVERLKQENQHSIQTLASFKKLEGEVIELREELLPWVQQFPANLGSQVFRRDVVTIGRRSGVTVRLWKPNTLLVDAERSKTPLGILIRVEGEFHDTVQFLDDLLEFSWVQSLEYMVLSRKQGWPRGTTVTTDLTIYGLTPKGLQHIQDLLQI